VQYDSTTLPLGSVSRVKAQLANSDLLKALKTCRFGGLNLDSVQPELKHCLERLYSKSPGVILSAYYTAGEFGPHTIVDLLRRLYEKRDFPAFLKQAYRFNVYSEMKDEIDVALTWHSDRKLQDATAWQRKFAKLREQEILRQDSPPPTARIEEDIPDNSKETPRVFQLKPLGAPAIRRGIHSEENLVDDPYIVSQTARAKMEKANVTHRSALQTLKTHLVGYGHSVAERILPRGWGRCGIEGLAGRSLEGVSRS
jgi:hypothetical protein